MSGTTGEATSTAGPSVLVVGSGAVGSLYGCMLQRAGCAVSLLCRSDYAAVRAGGIAVESVWGQFHLRPERVLRHAAECPTPPDFVLVALKVLPEIDVAALVRPALGPRTALVLVQNGVEIEPPLAAALPAHELISGLAFVCCQRVAPGRVRHLDFGRLALGSFPAGVSPRVEQLRARFAAAGVPCETCADVIAARWQKLLWNAPFNGLTVLSRGATTRDLIATPETAALARAIMEEVAAIAAAVGHPVAPGAIEKMLADTRAMTPYKPSMLLDCEAGRPMEVEAIFGNAVRAATRVGVPVPRLAMLYALLRVVNAHPA